MKNQEIPDPQKIAPSWHRPYCARRSNVDAQCNCNILDVFAPMDVEPFDHIEVYHEMTGNE